MTTCMNEVSKEIKVREAEIADVEKLCGLGYSPKVIAGIVLAHRGEVAWEEAQARLEAWLLKREDAKSKSLRKFFERLRQLPPRPVVETVEHDQMVDGEGSEDDDTLRMK